MKRLLALSTIITALAVATPVSAQSDEFETPSPEPSAVTTAEATPDDVPVVVATIEPEEKGMFEDLSPVVIFLIGAAVGGMLVALAEASGRRYQSKKKRKGKK